MDLPAGGWYKMPPKNFRTGSGPVPEREYPEIIPNVCLTYKDQFVEAKLRVQLLKNITLQPGWVTLNT